MSNPEQHPVESESIEGETFFENMERHLRKHREKQFPLDSLGVRYETLEEFEESQRQYTEAFKKAVEDGPQFYRGLGKKAIANNDLEGEHDG